MRLPQRLIESLFFSADSAEEIAISLGRSARPQEIEEMRRLAASGLPPITSVDAVSAMFGLNPGLVWSFRNRAAKHYRIYQIPKGNGVRTIASPRVGLKVIQTWASYHLSRSVVLPYHVFGFVPGRSHIDAAFEHRGADWAYSIDIENFFGSTPEELVASSLMKLGYSADGGQLLARLSSLNGYLAQGSPISPVLSNIAFSRMDESLNNIALRFDAKVTRYADDIVYSGNGSFPPGLVASVKAMFERQPWALAAHKERVEPLKGRIKVHGLIVNGSHVRLTKGYRNKLRGYNHILSRLEHIENERTLKGHVLYAKHVEARLARLVADPPQRPASANSFGDIELPRAEQGPEPVRSALHHLFDRIRHLLR